MAKGSSNQVQTRQTGASTSTVPSWIRREARGVARDTGRVVDDFLSQGAPKELDQAVRAVGDRAFSADPYFESATEVLNPRAFDRTLNFSSFMDRSTDPSTGRETVAFAPYNAETMSAFANPYEDAVVQEGLDDFSRQAELERIRAGDAAAAASAFGGSGHGVYAAEGQRNIDDLTRKFIAGTRHSGFESARSQYNTERDTALRALGMENDERLRGSKAITDLGLAKQDSGLRGAQALKSASDWQNQQRLLPLEALRQQASTLGVLPYTKKTTSSSTRTEPEAEPDRLGQLLGAGSSIAGAALMATPAAPAAPFLLSDKKLKKERQEVQPEEENALTAFRGMPIEEFQYKPEAVSAFGVPANDRVGPMAQDFAPAFGGDGSTIDIPNALGAIMLAIKELDARTQRKAA